MAEYVIWINANAGVVALIGIIFSFIIFWLLRWQRDEQGRDLRRFLYAQAIENRGYGSYLEEEALEGSKHKWIRRFFKRIFG